MVDWVTDFLTDEFLSTTALFTPAGGSAQADPYLLHPRGGRCDRLAGTSCRRGSSGRRGAGPPISQV